MTLSFWGHVTSSVTCPLDSQYIYIYIYDTGGQWLWSVESYGITTKHIDARPYTTVLYLFSIPFTLVWTCLVQNVYLLWFVENHKVEVTKTTHGKKVGIFPLLQRHAAILPKIWWVTFSYSPSLCQVSSKSMQFLGRYTQKCCFVITISAWSL